MILELHPLAVMSHFLLALVVVALRSSLVARGVEPSAAGHAPVGAAAGGWLVDRASASPPAR